MANIHATFQRDCADFVSHHVYGRVSMLVADLARLADQASGQTLSDTYLDLDDRCDWFVSRDKRAACESVGVVFEKSLDGSKWNWTRRAGNIGYRTAYDALTDMADRPWFEEQTGYVTAGNLLQDWIDDNLGVPASLIPEDLTNEQVMEAANDQGLSITRPWDEGGIFRWDFFDGPYDEDYNLEDVIASAYETIADELDDPEEFEAEVYEHWAVSDRLAYKLREHGEETFDLDGLTVWKRCTTGQAISIDGVIERIFQEEHEDA